MFEHTLTVLTLPHLLAAPVDDLDPGAVLAAAEATVRQRRAAELRDLLLVARWADLHAWDPQQGPGGRRWAEGANTLVQVGGEGTPLVQDLCLVELAVARGVHHLAARAATADVLDLRHRLPRTWAVVEALGCEAWVARRVARTSRHLDSSCVGIVDTAVAEAIGGESPARVLELAAAKVIEADRAAHAARLAEQLRRRFVGLGRADEHGLRHVVARVEAGAAVWIDAMVDRVADALATRPDLVPDLPVDHDGHLTAGKDELRAVALGWLAHPEDVVALLTDTTDEATEEDADEAGSEARRVEPRRRARGKGRVVVYLHLHQAALDGNAAVIRAEGLGPLLLEQVKRLVGHHAVDLHPVIDLAETLRVTAYEHPESVKERVHLRTAGEVFPHATSTSRRLDFDHCTDYDPHGPPGQTGDHNTGPLGRTNHRAKTHLAHTVRQTSLTSWQWTTPHGLRRRVDTAGTHHPPPASALESRFARLCAERGTAV